MAGGQLRPGRALTDPCIQDEGKIHKWINDQIPTIMLALGKFHHHKK